MIILSCYSAPVNYLEGLNQAQRDAVLNISGPLMILAGAGSGKTKTITHRIAHLISSGVTPESILAVTFTNKAANEMKERVSALLEETPSANFPISLYAQKSGPFISTFHSLGVYILRTFGKSSGIPRSFTIWDMADSIRAVKSSLRELGIEKQYEAKTILGKISRSKGEGLSCGEFAKSTQNIWEETVLSVWERYEKALESDRALDFDDLLLKTLFLLSEKSEVINICREKWQQITIDEYQDTNSVQFEIVRLLSEPLNNICAVGDIDQNIYSWRGADISHLLSFEETFPNTKVVLLEENYRSTKTILNAANDIISKNNRRHEKVLFTNNKDGEEITLYSARTEVDEAQFVAQTAALNIEGGTRPSEIAVLYRANFQSRALEEAFIESGIPYRVLGTRFFERKEVKDLLSYLRASMNPKSAGDIARIVAVPARGIGKQTLTRMLEGKESELTSAAGQKVDQFRSLLHSINVQAQTKPVSEVLKYIAIASGLEAHLIGHGDEGIERLENIKELVNLSTKYDELPAPEGAEKLLEDAALLGEQDSLEKGAEAVSLMTVHASKGLEFDTVFITGLEEGLFPHARHDENADEEEERRLFYVAITRARKKVFLSHAMSRMMYGSRDLTIPSQFLGDINPVYINSDASLEWTEGKMDLIDF
ncbi:ATP-dependent DNA helicase PcrA [Candidatus Kaiserbacteria bacterium CG10_big_fil_rev_8_21_14_0_10_43_70]|uniref:DNA 3'-5' helicase n=1 Tax=Candidatus Kaiserbacteria bacterium CG10_big_fil_rev_8_21_14_0_10_43_70 TaxID=1974605 RepID=A0A2H0UJ44_9BACT|nr:MAG: ATP-dependent DNA helicase PcrA [Candidatus Kaiserbacteria bacterium CG10_big_fil_rev_8_21_14_0_10_43_70]